MINIEINLKAPIDKNNILELNAGDIVKITGTIYTARDAAHKRMLEDYQEGKQLPFNLKNQVIYFAGPSPAKPNEVIGSVGPTTSSRMDSYSPKTIQLGISAMIGKGKISNDVISAMKKYSAVYIGAVGGAGALLASHVKKCDIIAYEDLGAEAIHMLEVVDFPGIVVIDSKGNNLYETEMLKYKR